MSILFYLTKDRRRFKDFRLNILPSLEFHRDYSYYCITIEWIFFGFYVDWSCYRGVTKQ